MGSIYHLFVHFPITLLLATALISFLSVLFKKKRTEDHSFMDIDFEGIHKEKLEFVFGLIAIT